MRRRFVIGAAVGFMLTAAVVGKVALGPTLTSVMRMLSNPSCADVVTATGGTVTFTRSGVRNCSCGSTSPDLAADEPCVTTRGVEVSAAKTAGFTAAETLDTWTKAASGVAVTSTANAAVAPDGSTTADRIAFPAIAGVTHLAFISRTFSTTTGSKYANSVWMKDSGGTCASGFYLWQFTSTGSVYEGTTLCTPTSEWTQCKNENVTATSTGSTFMVLGFDMRTGSGQSLKPACTVDLWGGDASPSSIARGYYGGSIVAESLSVTHALTDITTPWCVSGRFLPFSNTWVRGATEYTLFSWGTLNAAESMRLYAAATTGALTLSFWDGTPTSRSLIASAAPANGEHQVAFCQLYGRDQMLFVDGVLQDVTWSGGGTTVVSDAFSALRVGATSSGTPFDGWVYDVRMSKTFSGVGLQQPTMYAAIGDSITIGNPYTLSNPWPLRLQTSLTGTYIGNYAISGASIENTNTDQWDALVAGKPWSKVLVAVGVNDVRSDRDLAFMTSRLETLYEEIEAAGHHVVVLNIAPWGNHAQWTAGKQTVQDATNAWIAAWCAESPATRTCVDIYSALGDGVTPSDLAAAYDGGDGLHPSAAGAAKIAELVEAAL